jgi:hypothetical protein
MSLSKNDLEDFIKTMRGEFASINSKLTKMEAQLDTIVADNKDLKIIAAKRDNEILSLKPS